MKVIHIIPAAFDYFNDIKSAAFEIVENLGTFGVEAEAFTLQFSSTVSPAKQEEVAQVAPSREFKGMSSIAGVVEALDEFDLIHLHVPFFGAAKKILQWKEGHPEKPLVVTYYRTVPWTDLFSLMIIGYNKYYLKKFFSLAEAVVFQPLTAYALEPRGVEYVPMDISDRFGDVRLTELFNGVQLKKENVLAAKYALLYQDILEY